MSVKDLIARAKRGAGDRVVLPAAALRDLKKVLTANDKMPHKSKVSAQAFLDYLRKQYKVTISTSTLRVLVIRECNRRWYS